MTTARAGYTFVVLFRDQAGVQGSEMLRTALAPAARRPAQVQLPELRGLDFLRATGPVAAGLNAWWERAVRADTQPVFLAMDEDGLEEWIPGTDGCWFVGTARDGRGDVLGSLDEAVFPVVTTDPEMVIEQAMQAIGGGLAEPVFHPGFPYRQPPSRWTRPVPRVDPPLAPIAPPGGQEASAGAGRQIADTTPGARVTMPRPPARPISYEPEPALAGPAPAQTKAPPAPSRGRSALRRATLGLRTAGGRLRSAARLPASGRLGAATVGSPASLGPTVNANRPIVAGFASRKGGVGKTTHAAGVAATIGEALDGLPDTAALVDGNITNPDSWALNPPADTATVRQLVSRLTLGLDPPPETYARTPRLAIYPESRESEEVYTQAEIDVVAEYLRRRHSFIAVDLPNALPSLTSGGAGAVAAAWLVHCDVVVLPFNADPRARQGLLEYVAALQADPAFAALPVVAPYILSANRSISEDPAVRADIAELRRSGALVVVVPDDESALLALLRDLPINRASPGLRRAYVELTGQVVGAVISARRAR